MGEDRGLVGSRTKDAIRGGALHLLSTFRTAGDTSFVSFPVAGGGRSGS